MSNDYQEIARLLAASSRAVAFTGAGISTESGIPDFRSPGGIWATSQPVYYDDFLARGEARYEYWRQKAVAHTDFVTSKPNAGHRILAKWQRQRRLQAVITQNIDGLHQDAGSEDVIELHGTARFIACLKCRERYEAGPQVQQFLDTDRVPECPACGGLMKHATISFGQSLDPEVLERATELAANCDLFIALGSSLVVYPAAGLPQIATGNGARLVIINRDPTGQDGAADYVLHQSIGDSLTAIDEVLQGESLT